MTRQPKTPRTRWHLQIDRWREALGLAKKDWGYRRRKKGRRAKSGQWWRRYPRAVLWGSDVGRCADAVIGEAARRERETRMALEEVDRIVIDEHHDSRRVMEALEKCEPKMRTNA